MHFRKSYNLLFRDNTISYADSYIYVGLFCIFFVCLGEEYNNNNNNTKYYKCSIPNEQRIHEKKRAIDWIFLSGASKTLKLENKHKRYF